MKKLTLWTVVGMLVVAAASLARLPAQTRGDLLTQVLQIGSLTYTWPSSQAANTYLKNDGSGSLTWTAVPSSLSQVFRGLRMRTHPNHAVRDTGILIDRIDEVVLDDGTRIPDWDDISIDIGATGANGLDTGSATNNKWYGIWGIWNGTTRAGLLSRAPEFTKDAEAFTADTTTQAINSTSSNQRVGSKFTADATQKLAAIEVKLAKVGTPTGSAVWFEAYADSSGPTGAVLGTSDKIRISELTTTGTSMVVLFRDLPSVTVSTVYWVVSRVDYATSATDHVVWASNDSGGGTNTKALYDGASWTLQGAGKEMYHAEFLLNAPTVTMPPTYTGKALFGHTFRNSSGVLQQFAAVDRHVTWLDNLQFTTGAPTVVTLVRDVKSLPPIPVRAWIWTYRSTAVATWVVVGGVPDGFKISNSGATAWRLGGGIIQRFTATADVLALVGDISTETQHLYWVTNGNTHDLGIAGYQW